MEDNNRQNRPVSNRSRSSANQGQFKVNINFDDPDFGASSYQPKHSSNPASVNNGNGFSVNLPPEVTRRTTRENYVPQNARRITDTSPSPQVRTTAKNNERSAPKVISNNSKKTKASSKSGADAENTTAAKMSKAKKKQEKSVEKQHKKDSRQKRVSLEQFYINKQLKRDARIKSFVATIVCVIFIAICTVSLSVVAISTLNDILVINNDNEDTISVVVEEGDTFDTIFDKLAESGLLKQKQLVKLFCLYRSYDTVEYEPGVYYFETNDGVEAMLEEMMVSSTGTKDVISLTFPEGWTVAQIFNKIEKYEVCSAEKLYANLDIVAKQYDFYSEIDSSSGRYLMAEGYLFPDTYQFYIGESASSVLKKLFNNFEEKWTDDYAKRAKELGLSTDEILTIASIIQREAGNKEQMTQISSVLHNRLNNSANYPYLQCDSTKDYINSINELDLFESNYYYNLYSESYNTYSTKGLPPGPICNPGADAIYAALYPDDTSYYFFAHDSNGTIYLASTAEEHAANKNNILNAD